MRLVAIKLPLKRGEGSKFLRRVSRIVPLSRLAPAATVLPCTCGCRSPHLWIHAQDATLRTPVAGTRRGPIPRVVCSPNQGGRSASAACIAGSRGQLVLRLAGFSRALAILTKGFAAPHVNPAGAAPVVLPNLSTAIATASSELQSPEMSHWAPMVAGPSGPALQRSVCAR